MPLALIIEPNQSLQSPYSYIDSFEIQRCASVQNGLLHLSKTYPDIVFLSTSFSMTKTLSVLDALKNTSSLYLVPLVLVVDLTNSISHIPGTSWGDKLGILTSISNNDEFNSTLNRILTP